MRTEFAESFDNDVDRIYDAKLLARIKKVIERVEQSMTMSEIPKLKKLKGYRIHYRVRVGDYRIGLIIFGDFVSFERCLPRKDFYKHFPPK